MNTNALLIIDPQNDFCHPDGSMYVPGADSDMERLSKWIGKNEKNISYIVTTLDWHQAMDIAHPCFWVDSDNNHPEPFSTITFSDVESGKWKPNPLLTANTRQKAKEYIASLEARKGSHTVWPEHCLTGSWGAMLFKPVAIARDNWSRGTGIYPGIVAKGSNPLTEHYGAFEAEIPSPDDGGTQFNTGLAQELNNYDTIFVAGQAKSHCVASTVKQIMDRAPAIAEKMVIIKDCMSNVPGFEDLGTPIYNEAKAKKITLSPLSEVSLNSEQEDTKENKQQKQNEENSSNSERTNSVDDFAEELSEEGGGKSETGSERK